ncbi:MAG: hypothetical protein C4324_07735 [Blastocatellia bacterium]
MRKRENSIRQFTSTQKQDSDVDVLHAVLEKLSSIETRLQLIEEATTSSRTGSQHSSQDRITVAGTAELRDTKICSYEPGGKICDHCLMCTSRGF